MTLPSNLKDKKYQASFLQLLICSRAPWASKSTHPRKFGTHVTVHRQTTVCLHHRHANEKVGVAVIAVRVLDPGNEVVFLTPKRMVATFC